MARIGEAGLRDCVVLLVELKGNGVAWLRGDIRGLEGQSGATNDDSVVVRRGGGSGRGCSGRGSCARRRRRRRRRGICGGIPHGSSLERSELASGIDGENHAHLAVASLATVCPDRVGIGHLELRLLERSIGIVLRYGNAERKNQTRGGGQERKRDGQARVEATGSRRTGISEGGLCCRVILLHEDEGHGVSNAGILVMNGHLEVKTGHNIGNLPPRKG